VIYNVVLSIGTVGALSTRKMGQEHVISSRSESCLPLAHADARACAHRDPDACAGIGANAAIFTLVRGVLLKPLVNRDEDRLIYIRQSAPSVGDENSAFSVPEIQDLRASVKTLSAFGEFSTIEFTMIGLGEPRVVQAGVVDGPFFEVMGLHPVLGRLVDRQDDGPKAAGVVVLTYRFWTTTLRKDPGVIGKTVRLGSGPMGDRSATIIGVLEPSVPIPKIRKSSPTSSPARITFPPPWSPTGSTA